MKNSSSIPPKQSHHIRPARAYFFGFAIGFAILAFVSVCMLVIIWVTNANFLRTVLTGHTDNSETTGGTSPAPFEPVEQIERASLRNIHGTGNFYFIEYTDLECQFCKKFHTTTIKELQTTYAGRVAFVFKHFPLNVHSKAKREAIAAECAGAQNAFFPYVDRIFEITPSNNGLEDEALFTVAEELQLDMNAFRNCVDTEETLEYVSADALEAHGTGATGAPHSVLIDQTGKILNTFAGTVNPTVLTEAIDKALQENAY